MLALRPVGMVFSLSTLELLALAQLLQIGLLFKMEALGKRLLFTMEEMLRQAEIGLMDMLKLSFMSAEMQL